MLKYDLQLFGEGEAEAPEATSAEMTVTEESGTTETEVVGS